MSTYSTRASVLALTLASGLFNSADRAAASEPLGRRADDSTKSAKGANPSGSDFSGTVTAVTKRTITILGLGHKEAKPFSLSETLSSGDFPKVGRLRIDGGSTGATMIAYRYRVADVKVGDIVAIKFAHIGKEYICDQICIKKRPGGHVPPLSDEADPPKTDFGKPRIRYHEYMNAFWDLEDKGIAYPEKFGLSRRWPIAPMPRKLTLDGPIISK